MENKYSIFGTEVAMSDLRYAVNSKYSKTFKAGQKFGAWAVIDSRILYDERSRAYVLCVCEICKVESPVPCHHLVKGKTTQCMACNYDYTTKLGNRNPNHVPTKLPKAVRKTLPFSLRYWSDEDLIKILKNQQHKCYITGEAISVMSSKYNIHNQNARMRLINFSPVWVHMDVDDMLDNFNLDIVVKLGEYISKYRETI